MKKENIKKAKELLKDHEYLSDIIERLWENIGYKFSWINIKYLEKPTVNIPSRFLNKKFEEKIKHALECEKAIIEETLSKL